MFSVKIAGFQHNKVCLVLGLFFLTQDNLEIPNIFSFGLLSPVVNQTLLQEIW